MHGSPQLYPVDRISDNFHVGTSLGMLFLNHLIDLLNPPTFM